MSDEELIDALAKAIATSIFDGILPSPANVVDYRTEAVAALAVIAPELEALRAENARLRDALKPFANKELGFQKWCDDGLIVPISVELGSLRAARKAMGDTNKRINPEYTDKSMGED